jgi:hypothetical protein
MNLARSNKPFWKIRKPQNQTQFFSDRYKFDPNLHKFAPTFKKR